MKTIKIIVILMMLLFFLLIGTTEVTKTNTISETAAVKYTYYENARFGFSVEYPNSFTNVIESANLDGITCTDKDKNEFKVWSGCNTLNYNVQQEINISKKTYENLKLTSENIVSNSYVLTWQQNHNIIYQYIIVGTYQISGFQLTYAKRDSQKFEDIIKHITESFNPQDTV